MPAAETLRLQAGGMASSDSILDQTQLSCKIEVKQRGCVLDGETFDGFMCCGFYCEDESLLDAWDSWEDGKEHQEFEKGQLFKGKSEFFLTTTQPVGVFRPDDVCNADEIEVEGCFKVCFMCCGPAGQTLDASGYGVYRPVDILCKWGCCPQGAFHEYYLASNEHELDYWRRWGYEHNEDDKECHPRALFGCIQTAGARHATLMTLTATIRDDIYIACSHRFLCPTKRGKRLDLTVVAFVPNHPKAWTAFPKAKLQSLTRCAEVYENDAMWICCWPFSAKNRELEHCDPIQNQQRWWSGKQRDSQKPDSGLVNYEWHKDMGGASGGAVMQASIPEGALLLKALHFGTFQGLGYGISLFENTSAIEEMLSLRKSRMDQVERECKDLLSEARCTPPKWDVHEPMAAMHQSTYSPVLIKDKHYTEATEPEAWRRCVESMRPMIDEILMGHEKILAETREAKCEILAAVTALRSEVMLHSVLSWCR